MDREQPHRNPIARQSAGSQRSRRSRNHRLLPSRSQLRSRRPLPLGYSPYRHAPNPPKDLENRNAGLPACLFGGDQMITNPFTYSSPGTLQEALTLLEAPEAKLLAGGMSLIPLMKLRLASPESIVDLSRIKGLDTITESKGILTIGAMATHHAVESSPLTRAKCPLLAECAAHIGDIQVRNMGTMGGSVAHADPAADYPAALIALEAKIHLVSKSGDRTIEASEFFLDAFTTAMEPGEIVVDVQVPVEDATEGYKYEKLA